jgi:hypothetical protein
MADSAGSDKASGAGQTVRSAPSHIVVGISLKFLEVKKYSLKDKNILTKNKTYGTIYIDI